MATTAQDDRASSSELIDALESGSGMEESGSASKGRGRKWLIRGLVAVAVAVMAVAGFIGLAGTMTAKTGGGVLTHTVKRDDMLVTVTEDGTLESANNIDIKCEVAGGTTILSIVEDGKEVKEGEELARLNSAQIEDQITAQQITYEKARATKIQAEKNLAVAKLAVQEYLEGTYRQNSQMLDAAITVAMENLRSAENTLQYTERMFRKGYASPLQRDAQQFAVERAKLDLDAAKTAKDVLDRFTKAKTLEDLQSQAATAEATASSENASFALEEARLSRLKTQLAKCVIKAPRAGMVVYANDQSHSRFGSSSQTQIEEGAAVREQQTLFKFPDLSNMQVKVTVHESKVDMLRRGMRARIRVQDKDYQGTVFSIANQPEPTSFMSANVKEYATIVKIDGQPADIKPGMTAEAEILVADLKNVLSLPVAAVVELRGKYYAWVKNGEKIDRRPLIIGMTNNSFIEIKDGVTEGEPVVLNPRAVVAEARDEGGSGAEKVDARARFGTAGPEAAASPGDAGGPRGGVGGGEEGMGSGGRGRGERSAEPGAEGAGGPGGERGPGERRGGGGGSGASRTNLMDNDKDGDGKISREEAPERMQSFFDRLDANGDGFIDAGEAAAARSRSGSRGGGPGGERSERGPRGEGGGPQ